MCQFYFAPPLLQNRSSAYVSHLVRSNSLSTQHADPMIQFSPFPGSPSLHSMSPLQSFMSSVTKSVAVKLCSAPDQLNSTPLIPGQFLVSRQVLNIFRTSATELSWIGRYEHDYDSTRLVWPVELS